MWTRILNSLHMIIEISWQENQYDFSIMTLNVFPCKYLERINVFVMSK